ncbi:hypothetical protein ACFL1A_01720 [Patescibacteria group bacterium]
MDIILTIAVCAIPITIGIGKVRTPDYVSCGTIGPFNYYRDDPLLHFLSGFFIGLVVDILIGLCDLAYLLISSCL